MPKNIELFFFFFLDFLKFLLIEQLKYKYCPFLIL